MNENFESAGEQYHIHGILGDLRLFKGHNWHITWLGKHLNGIVIYLLIERL